MSPSSPQGQPNDSWAGDGRPLVGLGYSWTCGSQTSSPVVTASVAAWNWLSQIWRTRFTRLAAIAWYDLYNSGTWRLPHGQKPLQNSCVVMWLHPSPRTCPAQVLGWSSSKDFVCRRVLLLSLLTQTRVHSFKPRTCLPCTKQPPKMFKVLGNSGQRQLYKIYKDTCP